MSDQEKIFADGFFFSRRDNAPEWVLGRISVKLEDALPFLKQHAKDGYVNINVNMSQGGKPYCELDTFVPRPRTENSGSSRGNAAAPTSNSNRRRQPEPPIEDDNDGEGDPDELPF